AGDGGGAAAAGTDRGAADDLDTEKAGRAGGAGDGDVAARRRHLGADVRDKHARVAEPRGGAGASDGDVAAAAGADCGAVGDLDADIDVARGAALTGDG